MAVRRALSEVRSLCSSSTRRWRRAALLACALLVGDVGCGAATRATRLDPDASDKRFLLGADYFNKGLTGPALEELLKALELNPQNSDAHNLLGLLYLKKAYEGEELATRVQCLKGEALRLERDEIDGRFRAAEAEFRKAVEFRANYSEAWNHLAVVALHFGRPQQAIESAEKALSNIIYQQSYVAHGNLGQAYFDLHDWVRAAKALRQSLFDQPKFCVGRYRLAKVYYEQRDYQAAAEELRQVLDDKSCPIQEAFHLAGLVDLRRDDRPAAERHFRRCIALAPKSCLARECQLASGGEP